MPSFPFFLLVLLPIICDASPINRQVGISDNVFMTTQNGTDGLEQRVCSIDAVTYMDGETIPTSSPCEHCVCRPPGFACTITSCEYRPGCKAFRRSDQCCPEYQCECEKDGKIYQNGEKIMDNNNPCEVCYCQGGEIICAVIDCYWRNDCPPRYIDNRCCPMYDHCPPPAAQGPIRHRLPQLTSPVPISWHNLTQITSQLPSTTEVATEASTSTTTQATTSTTTQQATTSTTTEATTTTVASEPSSSSPYNDEESVSVTTVAPDVQSDNVVQVEPVVLNEAIIETSSSLADVIPIQTTTQPELQGSLDDEKETTTPMNADLEVHDEMAVTESLPSSTLIPSSIAHMTVQDSTTSDTPATHPVPILPSSVQQSPVMSPPTAAVQSEALPHNMDDVVTTSEANYGISQDDDVAPLTTNSPVLEEGYNDDVADVTQAVEQQFDVTEKTLPESADANVVLDDEPVPQHESVLTIHEEPIQENDINEHTTENVPPVSTAPIEQGSLPPIKSDYQATATDYTVVDDEVAVTSAPTVPSPLNDINQDRNEINPDELLRNELLEINSQGSLEAQDDEVPITTSSPTNVRNNEELTFADGLEGTTSRQSLLDEANNDQADQIYLKNPSTGISDAPTQFINNEYPTEVVPYVQNDEPEIVTQSISHLNNNDDMPDQIQQYTTVRPQADFQEDITQQPSVDADVASVTQSIKLSHDDINEGSQASHDISVTESAQELQHDDYQSDHVTHEDAVPTESVIEAIRENEGAEGLTSYHHHDAATDEQNQDVTEISQDEVTERLLITEETPILNDNVVTERIIADQPIPERINEKTENILVKDVSLKSVPVTNDIFDIILDDEIIPSKPETLNQIREVTEVANGNNNRQSGSSSVNQLKKSTLPNGQQIADGDTVQILNLAVVADERLSTGEETTHSPQLIVREDQVHGDSQHNDVNEEPSTTQVNNLEIRDDIHDSTTVLNDPVPEEATLSSASFVSDDEGIILNEETTQRQLRDDMLDDMLRHHLGIPHNDEQNATTVLPQAEEVVNDDTVVVTSYSVAADESQTTSQPDNLIYKNKVQKVSEALSQHNAIPESEEFSANKFRLELNVFDGSVENLDSEKVSQTEADVTTVFPPSNVELARRLGAGILNDVQTTLRPLNVLDDSDVGPTQAPEQLRDFNTEISTERIIYDSDTVVGESTETSPLQDEQVMTTPISRGTFVQDVEHDALEGSGSSDLVSHTETVLNSAEGNEVPVARLDLDSIEVTTGTPLTLDESESATNSYSFRMDLLNSMEDHGGSGHGDSHHDASVTSSPQLIVAFDAVTDQPSIVNDIPTSILLTNPEENAIQDEIATESFSRFRTDLEIGTEGSSNNLNDFVEVSTSAPSGLAIEFKENTSNDETATHAPVAHSIDEVPTESPEKVMNDDIINQFPDIIPDDEPITEANIPVLNLVANHDVAAQRIHTDKEKSPFTPIGNVLLVETDSQDKQIVANSEAASKVADITVKDETAPNDPNNEQVTQTHDVTANDESVTQATEVLAEHEVGRDETATSSNDELSVTYVPSNGEHVQDETVVFSDEPAPTVQPVDRLRTGLDSNEFVPTVPSMNRLRTDLESNESIPTAQPVDRIQSDLELDEPVPTVEPVNRLRTDLELDDPATTVEPVNRLRTDLELDEPASTVGPVNRLRTDLELDDPVSTVEPVNRLRTDLELDDSATTVEPVNRLRTDLEFDEPASTIGSVDRLRADLELDEPVSTVEPVNRLRTDIELDDPATTVEPVNRLRTDLEPDEAATTVKPVNRLRTDLELDEPVSTVEPVNRLRSNPDSDEQQTETIFDDTTILNDDAGFTTESPIAPPSNTKNTTAESENEQFVGNVVKRGQIVLPETGMPKIQPISPDLGRNNAHELRFDFPLPPEKESNWLSRAVNQFRKLAGFSG